MTITPTDPHGVDEAARSALWPWVTPQGSTCPSNPEAAEGVGFELYDTTLRDGEQQAGVCLGPDQKVRIFRALEQTGIRFIETGMLPVSEDEQSVVKQLRAEGHDSRVYVLSRSMEEDVLLARDCGSDGVSLEILVNDSLAEKIFSWDRDTIFRKASKAAALAKDSGLEVNLFGIDATRANLGWLGEFFSRLQATGSVDYVTIADTFGVCYPSGMSTIVTSLKEMGISLPIQVHCHEDYGLGVANSLAALQAGAIVIQGSMNHLGERAGNASIAQVAVAAGQLLGYEPNVDIAQLRSVAALISNETKIPLYPNEPVVGPTLFDIEAGIAAAYFEAVTDDLRQFYGYLPEIVGATPRVVMGKGSGIANVRLKLAEIGAGPMEESIERGLLARVKSTGAQLGRCLTDEEFRRLMEAVEI